jgi:hypothetical protein
MNHKVADFKSEIGKSAHATGKIHLASAIVAPHHRRPLLRRLVMLGLFVLTTALSLAAPDDSVRHGWLLDLSQAQQQSRQTRKPMMVVLRCEP